MTSSKPASNARQIINLIGSDKLELVRGSGYWYFVYDDLLKPNRYDTQSVYTMYLRDLSIDQWVEIGKDFVKHMEK